MKENIIANRAGLEGQYSPRTAGQNHLHPNTELGIDLKLFTRKPGRMPLGAYLDGIITHDGVDHFTFVQNAAKKSIAGLLEKEGSGKISNDGQGVSVVSVSVRFRGSVRFQNPLLILYNYLIISKLYIMIKKLIPSEKQLKQLKLKHLASISFI